MMSLNSSGNWNLFSCSISPSKSMFYLAPRTRSSVCDEARNKNWNQLACFYTSASVRQSVELDDTFENSVYRIKREESSRLISTIPRKNSPETNLEKENSLDYQWNDGAVVDTSPWGEKERVGVEIKAPQVAKPVGSKSQKNSYKGIKKQEDKVKQHLFGDSDHLKTFDMLKFGILEARGKNELIDFLAAKAQNLKQADVRRLLEACLEKHQTRKMFDVMSFMELTLKRPLGSRAMTQMISICGRYGEAEAARSIFDTLLKKTQPDERDIHPFNALINAYSKNGMFEEAADVLNMLLSGEALVQPDKFSLSSGIAMAVKASRYEYALEIYEEMTRVRKLVPDIITFSAVAFSHCRLGKPWLAEALIAEMTSLGVFPDSEFYGTVVSGYVKNGMYLDAFQAWEQAESLGLKSSGKTLASLMHAYGKLGNSLEVERLYVRLLKQGIPPDLATYNSLIECYVRSREMDKAEAVLGQMLDTCRPTIRSFTCLMIGYGELGRAEQVLEVYRRMQRSGVQADEHSLGVLVSAHLKELQVEKAEELLEEVWAEGRIFPVEATNMLLAYQSSREDTNAVISLVQSARKYTQPLDARSWGLLFGVFAKRARFGEMERFVEEFLEAEGGQNRGLGGLVCFAFVQSYGKLEMARQAKAFFTKGRENGWANEMATPVKLYNAVIIVLARAEMFDDVEVLFQEMKSGDGSVRPDVVTYNAIIDGYGKAKRLDRMESLFVELKSRGLKPTVTTFTSLINAYGRVHNLVAVDSTFDEMVASKVEPNEVTYKCIVSAFCAAGYLGRAEDWFFLARKDGKLSADLFSTRIIGYLNTKRFSDAQKIALECREAGFSLDSSLEVRLQEANATNQTRRDVRRSRPRRD